MKYTGIPWFGRPARLWPVVALLVVLIVAIQLVRDRRYEAYRAGLEVLYIPSGTVLQRMALSFDALLADVYWIRAIQYYGGAKLADEAERNYALLYPLLDITTTLDPRFNVAYRFGAIFLTEAYPDGPGRPDEAVALLEKGVRQMPGRWEYLQDIGFVHYWWLHDYETAAQWFRRAGEIPGSAWWLESLAANTLAVGGNRDGSRRLWQQMHETGRQRVDACGDRATTAPIGRTGPDRQLHPRGGGFRRARRAVASVVAGHRRARFDVCCAVRPDRSPVSAGPARWCGDHLAAVSAVSAA